MLASPPSTTSTSTASSTSSSVAPTATPVAPPAAIAAPAPVASMTPATAQPPPAATQPAPTTSQTAPAPAPAPAPTPAPAPASPTSHGQGLFPNAPWYQDVSSAPLDAESSQVINGLQARGGWGTGTMRVDFSIEILRADASTPMRTFDKNDEFYDPDCDDMPMPVPAGGRLEGESNYTCSSDGDCHLIVIKGDKLFEMWRANISGGTNMGGTFTGGCLAVWDLKRDYWNRSGSGYARGDQCTSADAAGYPVADLLFSPEEVKAGEIKHAIRFILPNDRIRKGQMVYPATHSGAGKGTPTADTVPYGARLRLKKSFDLNSLKPGARVVAKAMQKYGMFLADGGNIALTAKSDSDSAVKWEGLLDAADLAGLKVSDFEMVEAGSRQPVTHDCNRTAM